MTERDAGRCEQMRALIPEVAMGVAPGEIRAAVLAHTAGCDECRQLLEDTTELVDELVLLAPESEPPAGFEARVMARMRERSPWLRRTSTWLAAAAVVLAALGGGAAIRWADSSDRTLAGQYRQTLRIADGKYLHAADLVTGDGAEFGHVFAYEGKPSWVFMTVTGAPSGDYDVRLVTRDGQVRDLGECWVRDGRGSWGTEVDQPIDSLARVEMSRPGSATLTATFTATFSS